MKIVKKNIILIILMLLISVTIFAESFDHAGTNIVERIRLFEGEEEVEIDENFGEGDSKVVWIYNDENGNPHMPDLRIVLEPSESIDYKMKLKLHVNYPRDNRQTYDNLYFPQAVNEDREWHEIGRNANKEWELDFGEIFIGGTATLTWEAYSEDENGNDILVANREEVFYIRGENPDDDDVENYIDNHEEGDHWYIKPIARHESGGSYIHFNEGNTHPYGPNPDDYKYCPNRGAGGDPYGWGMMQLDNPEPEESDLVWNWQDNVNNGIELLEDKRGGAEDYLDRQMVLAGGSDSAPEIDMEDFPDIYDWWYDIEDDDGNIIRRVHGSHEPEYEDVTFQDSRDDFHPNAEFNFLDAVTIKRYNGASRPESDISGNPNNGNFIEWDEENEEWICHPLNSLEPPNNYVEDICSEYSENN